MRKTFKENYGVYKNFQEYYDKGLSDIEISKLFNCNSATVSNWRNRNNLISNGKKSIENRKRKALELYHLGKTRKEIEQLLNEGKHILDPIFAKKKNNKKYERLSKRQISAIIGTLLGDGYVNNKGLFGFTHKYLHKDYVMHKANIVNLSHKISYREQYRNETLCKSYACTFHTHPFFKNLRTIFYPEGKKIFPQSYCEKYFTWESLAYWYLDDGCFRRTSSLAIHNLKNQSEEIKEFFKMKFDLSFNIVNKGKILYLPTNQFLYFKENIEEFIPESLLYKIGPH